MSHHTTIAAVTSALGQVLDAAVTAAVPAATVQYARPDSASMDPKLYVYMYQARPNPAARNLDLPTRDSEGVPRQRPFEALDLYYLLTFVGNDGAFEPQLMMGSVVSALNAMPVLSPEAIRSAQPGAMEPPFIGDSLDVPVVPVRLSPIGLNLDELSKVWSVFFQTPYALSIAYQASVVLVEADILIRPALPAQRPAFRGEPLSFPEVAQVLSGAGRFFPISVDTGVVITGRRLTGEITLVRIDGVDAEPDAIADDRVTAQLPASGLLAGVHGLRVVNRVFNADPTAPVEEVESNLVSFVLHPVVRGVSLAGAALTVEVGPGIDATQRVELLLDQIDAIPPEVRAIELAPFTGTHPVFDVTGVPSGTYAVRVRVDGATSQIEIDEAAEAIVHTVTL